jgi:hypothetical protein
VSKPVKQVQPQAMPQPVQDPLQQKLNRLSVKFSAKTMLEQEFGESLSDFINTANQVIAGLQAQLAKVGTEQKEDKSKQ